MIFRWWGWGNVDVSLDVYVDDHLGGYVAGGAAHDAVSHVIFRCYRS